MFNIILIAQQIPIDTLDLDALNFRLGAIQNTIEQQLHAIRMTYAIWVPLLSSIIGGLLVLIPQHLDRKSKRNTDRRNNLREIYSSCRKSEELLKFNLRNFGIATPGFENEEFEKRIEEIKADFIGNARKFQVIEDPDDIIEKHLERISDLSDEKFNSFDTAYDKKEVNELYKEYQKKIKEINNYLQLRVKRNPNGWCKKIGCQ